MHGHGSGDNGANSPSLDSRMNSDSEGSNVPLAGLLQGNQAAPQGHEEVLAGIASLRTTLQYFYHDYRSMRRWLVRGSDVEGLGFRVSRFRDSA